MAWCSNGFAAVAVGEYSLVDYGGAVVSADDVGGGEGCGEENAMMEAYNCLGS